MKWGILATGTIAKKFAGNSLCSDESVKTVVAPVTPALRNLPELLQKLMAFPGTTVLMRIWQKIQRWRPSIFPLQ